MPFTNEEHVREVWPGNKQSHPHPPPTGGRGDEAGTTAEGGGGEPTNHAGTTRT